MENTLLFPEDLRKEETFTGKAFVIFERKTCGRAVYAFNNGNGNAESAPGVRFGSVYSGSFASGRFNGVQGYGSKRKNVAIQ